MPIAIPKTSMVFSMNFPLTYKVVPPNDSVQLVYNSNFTMVYGTYNYSIHGIINQQT